MIEKRFELRLCSNGTYYVYENGTLTDIDFDKFNMESAYALIDEVNALYEENEQLRKQKARYKRLSEIRNEEINNRILTIKEFIDNCSNEKVKKALEDLFYSEVNEYDLSKKYRKLREENEDLKEDNAILKQSHKEILRDLDGAIFDKAFLQKEKEGLYEENKRLKQQLNRLYNYFEDWYRDMTSANDFSEIWDNVKEDERWGDV